MLGTFTVYFSDPAARFGGRTQEPWKLAGQGELTFDADRIVLRGSGSKPLVGSGASTEIAIPLTDILNVVRAGTLVQFHVRSPRATHALQLWSDTEQQAEQLVQALPKERTPEFEKQVAEHGEFYKQLDALGTRGVVTRARRRSSLMHRFSLRAKNMAGSRMSWETCRMTMAKYELGRI